MSGAFRAPLILASANHGAVRWATDALVTIVLWLTWAWLLLAALNEVWLPPALRLVLHAVPFAESGGLLSLMLFCGAAGSGVALLISLRALLEQQRFRRADRRRANALVTGGMLAATFGVDAASLAGWQEARRLVVHHDDAGAVQLVTAGLPGCALAEAVLSAPASADATSCL